MCEWKIWKMFLAGSWLLFMQLELTYSTNESIHRESLIFIYPGESPTAVEELNTEECSKEQAVKLFYDGLSSHRLPPYPVAVVSGLCPDATQALAAISKHYCLPVISYSSSLEFPNKQDLFPHLFSVVPSDYYFAVATVRFINYYNWRRAVLITKDQEHNKKLKEEILSLSNSNNISVIGDLVFPALASRLKGMHIFLPDVRIFILNVDSNEAKFIFCLAMRQSIERYSYVWIIPGWYADRWWETGGDVILDDYRCSSTELAMFIVHQRVIAISHHPYIIMLNSTLSEDGVCIQDNSARMLLNDAQQIIMQKVQHTFVEGPVGNYSSCSNRIELSLCSPEIDDCFNRTLTSIRSASIQSDSGAIEFDEAGSRIPGVVNVFQYRAVDKCKVHVAVINVTSNASSLEFIGGEDTLWIDGVPSDGTPRTREDYIPVWLTVTANIWSGLVIVTSVAFIVFMFLFRKRKLVRLTSPSLNYVIATGIIMFNIGGMMFIQYRISLVVLHIFCSIRAWLVSIGISLSFVTIDVKMWRIFYIFHYPNPSKRNKLFKDWHLFLVVMMCVAVDVFILTIASSVNSARLEPVETRDVRHGRTEVDEEGITLNYTVYLCASRWRLIWLGMLFGYKAIIQMIGLIVALRMRNIKIDILNDSKEVVLTIYFTSTILAVVIIVSVVWEENLTIYSVTYAYGIAISTTAILITVFFTKVYKLYKDPHGEKIFTHEHEVGANALSGTGGSAIVTSNFPLASDDDRAQALERKLRQVEMELKKYKSFEVAVMENKTNKNGVDSSTDTLEITNADNAKQCVEHLHP